MVRHKLTVVNNPFETGDRMVLDGVIPSEQVRLSPKEPRDRAARSEFQSEIPQIVWCDPTDSSHRYGRGSQRARWGISGERHPCRLVSRFLQIKKGRHFCRPFRGRCEPVCSRM